MGGALEVIPASEECHSVAGEPSLLLEVRVASPPALLELTERLRQIPGVEGTDTTIVLATQFDPPFHALVPQPPARASRERAGR